MKQVFRDLDELRVLERQRQFRIRREKRKLTIIMIVFGIILVLVGMFGVLF